RILLETGIVLALFAATAAVLTLLRAHPRAIVAALLIAPLDLGYFDARTMRTAAPEDYDQPPWYSAHIGPERRDYRLLDLTTNDATPGAHGFRRLNGSGSPRPEGLDFIHEPLEDLNVRWLISTVAPPDDRWAAIGRK